MGFGFRCMRLCVRVGSNDFLKTQTISECIRVCLVLFEIAITSIILQYVQMKMHTMHKKLSIPHLGLCIFPLKSITNNIILSPNTISLSLPTLPPAWACKFEVHAHRYRRRIYWAGRRGSFVFQVSKVF